jgi:glycerol-3-phosphate dehydrogenase
MKTIAILGAGSWGTALAAHLGQSGHHGAPRERDVSA